MKDGECSDCRNVCVYFGKGPGSKCLNFSPRITPVVRAALLAEIADLERRAANIRDYLRHYDTRAEG